MVYITSPAIAELLGLLLVLLNQPLGVRGELEELGTTKIRNRLLLTPNQIVSESNSE